MYTHGIPTRVQGALRYESEVFPPSASPGRLMQFFFIFFFLSLDFFFDVRFFFNFIIFGAFKMFIFEKYMLKII
jgi:hypothetical protein